MSDSKTTFRIKFKAIGAMILTGLSWFYHKVLRPLGIGLAWPVRKIGLGIAWCFKWLRKYWEKLPFAAKVDAFYVTKPMQYVRKTIFVLACILVWVLVDVLFLLGPTLKYVIFPTTNLVMRTELSVDTMVIQPLLGYVHIENLVLQNPRTFKEAKEIYVEEPLVKVGHLLVNVSVLSLFTDTLTIDAVEVTDCSALYAWDCGTNNVEGLLEQMGLKKEEAEKVEKEAEAKVEKAEAKAEVAAASETKEAKKKHLLIRHLLLHNNEVTLRYHGTAVASFNSLLNIELTDATEEDITSKVLGDKFSPIVKAWQFCSENLTGGYDALVGGLSSLGGAVGDGLKAGTDAAVEGIKSLGKGVSNLFGGESDK